MRRTPDEAGRRGMGVPKRFLLIVGPVNEWKAYSIMNTMQVQGSNNNDTDALNKYKSRIEVLVVDELDTWDGWILLDRDNMPVEYFEGMAPTFTNQRDFETSTHLFKSEFEFSIDFHTWRGAIVNPGT